MHRQRIRSRAVRGWAFGLSLLLASISARVIAAVPPTYLRQALEKFTPGVPPNWAYTVTTEQGPRRTTERFDPSLPPVKQWQLLLIDGHPPSEKELTQYQKHKANQAPGATRATYTKADIEPFSFQVVKENEHSTEFIGGFRSEAAGGDKMFSHLNLRLVVTKQPAAVSQATLELIAPYSPVLTVKMNKMVASIDFSPATDGQPPLPQRSSSHFVGRMLFFSVEENLLFTYKDYVYSP